MFAYQFLLNFIKYLLKNAASHIHFWYNKFSLILFFIFPTFLVSNLYSLKSFIQLWHLSSEIFYFDTKLDQITRCVPAKASVSPMNVVNLDGFPRCIQKTCYRNGRAGVVGYFILESYGGDRVIRIHTLRAATTKFYYLTCNDMSEL